MSKMQFTEDDVRKVAALARLELTSEEVTRFAGQLGNILGYIQKLGELDTKNVEPMTTPHKMETPLREDVAQKSPGAEAMLACAPEHLYDNYKVPQVLGGES